MPTTSSARFAAALDAHAAGRLDEAQARYGDLLALDPTHAEALHYSGVARHQLGDHAGALALIDRALALAPANATCWSHRGLAAGALGRRDEAVRALREALRLNPEFADAHNNLGLALREAGEAEAALVHFRAALALDARAANAQTNLASTLARLGRHDEALAAYRVALALTPDDPALHFNLGNAWAARGDHEAAIASFRHATRLRPDYARAWINLGTALGNIGAFHETEACYREAVRHEPSATNLVCLGAALGALGRNDEEEPFYRRALELDPANADARQNLVWLQLKRGEYREGWAEYAKRWRALDYAPFDIEGIVEWRGEPLEGKRVLLVHEQGFGDQIQFVRYASVLNALGATVDACMPPPMLRLAQSVPGVRRAWAGAPEGAYDYWVYVMSVPSCVGTELHTIPAEVPYLFAPRAEIDAWRPRVQAAMRATLGGAVAESPVNASSGASSGAKPRKPAGHRNVGLCWAGNAGFYNDRNRSVALDALRPVLDTANVSWFSLQKGEAARAQLEALAQASDVVIHDFTAELHDFADTAALIMQLDLVIAVDTAVAHLAGALGKPVWILVPANAEWRWLEARTDSPWYPTARLFRQREVGDWREAIAALRDALAQAPKRPRAARTEDAGQTGAPREAAPRAKRSKRTPASPPESARPGAAGDERDAGQDASGQAVLNLDRP
ncbi:tetratricopeptide repeat protein [Paraburkholderia acidisoli]|nr:tetratricopeptide repeat protein [Paraburkholderia acidisoli]